MRKRSLEPNAGRRPARALAKRTNPDRPGCGQFLRPPRGGASSVGHPLTLSGPPALASRTFCGCAMTPRAAAPAPELEPRALRRALRQAANTRGRRCPWSHAPRRYSPEEQAGRSPGPPRLRLLSAPGAPTARRASPAPAPRAGPLCLLPAGTPHSVIGWRRGSLARACGCSYKNPRVPALSCSKSATALPIAAPAPPERSGRRRSREAGGGKRAGHPHRLPRRPRQRGREEAA